MCALAESLSDPDGRRLLLGSHRYWRIYSPRLDIADLLIEAEGAYFRDVSRCRAGCNHHFASSPPVSRDHRFRDEYATLEQTKSVQYHSPSMHA